MNYRKLLGKSSVYESQLYWCLVACYGDQSLSRVLSSFMTFSALAFVMAQLMQLASPMPLLFAVCCYLLVHLPVYSQGPFATVQTLSQAQHATIASVVMLVFYQYYGFCAWLSNGLLASLSKMIAHDMQFMMNSADRVDHLSLLILHARRHYMSQTVQVCCRLLSLLLTAYMWAQSLSWWHIVLANAVLALLTCALFRVNQRLVDHYVLTSFPVSVSSDRMHVASKLIAGILRDYHNQLSVMYASHIPKLFVGFRPVGRRIAAICAIAGVAPDVLLARMVSPDQPGHDDVESQLETLSNFYKRKHEMADDAAVDLLLVLGCAPLSQWQQLCALCDDCTFFLLKWLWLSLGFVHQMSTFMHAVVLPFESTVSPLYAATLKQYQAMQKAGDTCQLSLAQYFVKSVLSSSKG